MKLIEIINKKGMFCIIIKNDKKEKMSYVNVNNKLLIFTQFLYNY